MLGQEPRPKGVLGYVLSRYTWYIDRLQRSLESEMPRTYRVFRTFSVGLKAFAKDFVWVKGGGGSEGAFDGEFVLVGGGWGEGRGRLIRNIRRIFLHFS